MRSVRRSWMATRCFARERIAGMVRAERVRTAGRDVAYDRAGSGPPLVLVHGAASDAREWRLQIAGLSDDFTVIAWDAPGAGRSSNVPADLGLGRIPDRARRARGSARRTRARVRTVLGRHRDARAL